MLNTKDVRIIKGMLKRGDRQSDIASWFGINSGRIAEISTSQKWPEVGVADWNELPPAGPYMAYRSATKAKQTLEALRDLIDEALKDIEDWESEAIRGNG